MILRILSFFSYSVLVSSNTGFPIIPAQTYPIYQQNGYANPVLYQPNNIAPYLQNMITQNQSPSMNISPSNVKQILLNKILSSPSLQSILGSNFGGYGSNLVDFNNYPIAQNPVNNYLGAPTVFEYLNDKSVDVNKDDKVDIKSEKPKKSKKKSSKSRRKQEESEGNENISRKNNKTKDKNTLTVENSTETSKKSKKRKQHKKNIEVSSLNETENKENESNSERKTKRRKKKEKEQSKNDSTDKDVKAENSKPRRRRKKKPKKEEDNLGKDTSEQQNIPSVAPKEIKEGIDVVNLNEGIVDENRVPRNPIPEGSDSLKALPLPENTGTNFMKTLSQFDNNPYMSNFFANYENIYQSMLANGIGKIEKKEKVKTIRRKRTRKHDKKRTAQTKHRNSTEVVVSANSNSAKVNTKINVVTTERTIIINEKTHNNVESMPKGEALKSFDKISEMKEQILKEDGYYKNPQQDSYPTTHDNGYFSNGYIEDYYPLFTDNAAYNANNKEVYVKHLGDTKYYYAIDKDNPAINRRRFEHYQFPERVVKDYEVSKHYEDIEKEGMKNFKTEIEEKIKDEIKFRSPPHLELPDFQTRKIDKSEINPQPVYNFEESSNINHRFVGDKSQNEDKGNKHKNNRVKLKDEPKDIETVFARSKVVKYGSVVSSEEDISNVGINDPVPSDETYFKDEGTTYVLAKSLDYPKTFW